MDLAMEESPRAQAGQIKVVISGTGQVVNPGQQPPKFHPKVVATIMNDSEDLVDVVRILWKVKGANRSESLRTQGHIGKISGYGEYTFELVDYELEKFVTLSSSSEFSGGWDGKSFDEVLDIATKLSKHFEVILGFKDANENSWNLFPDERGLQPGP
jgi:hypothetical protein